VRGHLEDRVGSKQLRSELSRHTGRCAKQKQAKAAARAQCGERRDEIDTRHRRLHGTTLPPGCPDNAAAVGEAKVCRPQHPRELRVYPRPHHELGIDSGDEMVAACVHQLLDPLERLAHVQAIDSHAKDADLVHRLIIIRRLTKTVAVDLNPAIREVVTGTEVFAREVGRRLKTAAPELDWRYYASRPRAGLGVDLTVAPFPRLWSQVRLPLALARAPADLLFVPSHVVPFAWFGKALTVVHDLAFERHPKAYSRTERAYLRLTTGWAVRRCPVIITISESTKSDLISLYGVKPERIRVVPLGGGETVERTAAPKSRLAELGLDGRFVLQVGRIEPRKNQAAALAAVERLDGVTLAVAGPQRDWVLSTRLAASTRCRVLGRVDQPTLELLYQEAAAVVVPSLYEGFGLPVLEAMARGKVVVAAASSSLPEVGGDAVLYVSDPADPDALAKVLETALGDQALRAKLERSGRKRAAEFTWDRCAAGVAAVIREMLK
jgi:glycosyltransferase involved in cell wall biosynthesis